MNGVRNVLNFLMKKHKILSIPDVFFDVNLSIAKPISLFVKSAKSVTTLFITSGE